MARKNVSLGSPFEKAIGFSRAVRVDNRILVAGTAPIADDGTSAHPGDAYLQTKRCLEIIKAAIEEAGGQISDVVRTRMYLTDPKAQDDVGRAHGEYFGDIRPVSTMVMVDSLCREEWLIEMEAE